MLREMQNWSIPPSPRWARLIAVVILATVAVSVSALRSPAQKSGSASGQEAELKDILVQVHEQPTGSLIFGVGVKSGNGLTGSIVRKERTLPKAVRWNRTVGFEAADG